MSPGVCGVPNGHGLSLLSQGPLEVGRNSVKCSCVCVRERQRERERERERGERERERETREGTERGVWTLDVLHRHLAPLTLDSFALSDSPGDVPLKSSLGPPGKARSHFPESHAAGEAVRARGRGWVAGMGRPGGSSLRPAPSAQSGAGGVALACGASWWGPRWAVGRRGARPDQPPPPPATGLQNLTLGLTCSAADRGHLSSSLFFGPLLPLFFFYTNRPQVRARDAKPWPFGAVHTVQGGAYTHTHTHTHTHTLAPAPAQALGTRPAPGALPRTRGHAAWHCGRSS